MKKSVLVWVLGFGLIVCQHVMAQLPTETHDTVALGVEGVIKARLQASFPEREIHRVKSVLGGQLYRVEFTDGFSLYTLAKGRYVLTGNLYETQDQGYINLTEQDNQLGRAELLNNLQLSDYLVIDSLIQPAKAVVYLFVDIDCYYCQVQHGEIDALTAAGVELRYLSFTRQKPGSSAYKKVVRTWCSNRPRAALDMLMKGRSLAVTTVCDDSVVERHAAIVRSLGVKRLPSIVLADGRLVQGLLRADQLLSLLGIAAPVEAEAEVPPE